MGAQNWRKELGKFESHHFRTLSISAKKSHGITSRPTLNVLLSLVAGELTYAFQCYRNFNKIFLSFKLGLGGVRDVAFVIITREQIQFRADDIVSSYGYP